MRCSITNATIEQVKATGAQNVKAPHSIPVVFADLTPAQVQQLEAQGVIVSKVAKVKADVSTPVEVSPPVPVEALPTYTTEQLIEITGLEELRGMFDPPIYGEGFNVAIVDTGIRETHEMIGGQVVYSKNYTSGPMQDGFDHGTGVASILHTLAPLCGILNMKVLDNNGEGTEEEVVSAIDDCLDLLDEGSELAPCTINLSLGCLDDGNPDSPMRVICRTATERGIWINAAAGNTGPDPGTITSPACDRYVFATGSAKYLPAEVSFEVSSFSSRGPTKEGLVKPDNVAFGEDIIVASSSSDSATTSKSGSSFSTPLTSGIAVLYHECETKQIPYTQPIPGILEHGEIGRLISMEELIDVYLPAICGKPSDAPSNKDNDYGSGMILGPLIVGALEALPGVNIASLIMPILMIGMMGMMIKAMK